MDGTTLVGAALLGLLEGLTEFIPVSSTAHLLLAGHFLGFNSPGNSFEVLIQLGAILAILSVYFARLWKLAMDLPTSAEARRFVGAILLAFLPAAVIGVMAHGFIKTVLFESTALICWVLIGGGIVLLIIDRMPLRPKYTNVMDYPLSLAFKIGLVQCLAMIPGTSRSGATIAGALLLGADKRSAAEFSFFLAMPTMAGAFAYDLYKNYDKLGMDDVTAIIIGFVMAFIAGVIVVRSLLDFVSKHGFAPFAWWRIAVGTLGLIGLWLF
ncbi:undecaprenyl-diphosphatase UppP [Hoeflea phototrophica DFL-43]|jgi:undecaprenyl-diphosphatase|uniref:Undecaprenyl-diphosphatase n=1 Tax=Hoeflea phototrophica (strain DSM 17068 / NCIMB 14078 / DFL-43) TaxID=411684 RepID=A9CV81_HOEPD|nr:undecaprenyl-diphosphate phosphatase [Hoeflea phototrophica]EDQ35338.1 undecaprenyl-diphosphatase UppP [Hoeflea phototrophica DFL-43]